jgi:glycerophosphoryl diester phosphodiesterase
MGRLLLLAAALGAGCGSPREVAAPPPVPAHGAVSSVHYRDFADADALAGYLAWRPGAPVLVSAYQGGTAPGLPENALATFEYALNFAPVLVETTVRRTADGALLLLRDATLDRTTTGTGPVAARTLAELRTLYLLDPASGVPTPHRIPTLAEALAWAEGRAVLVLDPEDVPREALVAAIRESRAEDRVVIVTDSYEDEGAYRQLAGEFVYSFVARPQDEVLIGTIPGGPSRRIAFLGAVDPDLVTRLHALGIRVRAAAPDPASRSPDAYRPLLDAGVDVLVSSDVPSAARAVRGAPSD